MGNHEIAKRVTPSRPRRRRRSDGGEMATETEPETQHGPGSRPIPDPTVLTSRAVDALRKELTDIFAVEMDGLAAVTDERFNSIKERLLVSEQTSERQRLEQKADTSKAVDAALAAAEKSVVQQTEAAALANTKTENNFAEQLKGLRDTFGTAIAAQTTRYDDLKQIVSDIQAAVIAINAAKTGGEESKTGVYAIIGLGATLLFAGVAVLGFIFANSNPTP